MKLRSYCARRRWQRCGTGVRALKRMSGMVKRRSLDSDDEGNQPTGSSLSLYSSTDSLTRESLDLTLVENNIDEENTDDEDIYQNNDDEVFLPGDSDAVDFNLNDGIKPTARSRQVHWRTRDSFISAQNYSINHSLESTVENEEELRISSKSENKSNKEMEDGEEEEEEEEEDEEDHDDDEKDKEEECKEEAAKIENPEEKVNEEKQDIKGENEEEENNKEKKDKKENEEKQEIEEEGENNEENEEKLDSFPTLFRPMESISRRMYSGSTTRPLAGTVSNRINLFQSPSDVSPKTDGLLKPPSPGTPGKLTYRKSMKTRPRNVKLLAEKFGGK
ncbi:histone H3.v1 isoform X2 [Eurytemora carolleeae]|nr:histone H3.v1 isoform X2 [Eurytemora carolleeae]|eukprot:XP_023328358.1 histone H3.v1-like isoform X2 [Eurytemora affinis]